MRTHPCHAGPEYDSVRQRRAGSYPGLNRTIGRVQIAIVDPNSPEYRSVFLAVNGSTKRNLGVALGHETSHLDYGPGRGYLPFADSIPTQEGLADAAGKRLVQLLGEQSPGIWDTAGPPKLYD